MKFGGTSVESASARTRRRDRESPAGTAACSSGVAMGRPPTSCWPSRRRPSAASARLSLAASRSAVLPFTGKPGKWFRWPTAPSSTVPWTSTFRVDRAGQGPGRAGRADAALDRCDFQLWRAPVELHRVAGVPPFRNGHGARGLARVIVHRPAHTQAAPLFSETYARLEKTIPPLAQTQVVVMADSSARRGWRHYQLAAAAPITPRPSSGRHRRERDPDLDRLSTAC